jgi:two-component system chemotaxis response regulator CheB
MKILVVDDSLLYRKMIRDAVSGFGFVSAVETADSGREALAKAKSWRPDVITLDVDMPDMSGIRVLRELHAAGNKASVVVVSALAEAGSGVAVLATEFGAVDVVAKPRTGNAEAAYAELARQLGFVLSALAVKNTVAAKPHKAAALAGRTVLAAPTERPDIVAVAASTGGPAALARLVARLPEDFRAPLLITLHLAAGHTRPFAEALGRRSSVRVMEGENDLPLSPGTVYLAPGGRQMGVARGADNRGVRLLVNDDPAENDCRPSADYLFRSVANVYGSRALGIILTGMGKDGVRGLQSMKARGAFVMAQNEESSVVFGMPAAAIEAGIVDFIASPEDLVSRFVSFVQRQV